MKRFRLLSLCLTFAILVGTLVGCSGGSKDEALTLKLANVSALGDERDLSLQEFKRLVEEKSSGKIKVEVYSGGTLGGWRDTIEGLEAGIVQIVCESIGTLEPYSKTASIDAYPYLYRDYDHYKKVMNGEIGEQLLATVGEEGGFEIMGPSYRGARIMTTNKKVESADDLKGLKIRAPGIQMYIKTWEYLGASPVPMDATEIYTGLQQGTVDAQENPVLFSYGNAYYDVCDYLVMTNHVMSTDVFIFNDDFYNGLPADTQKILKESAIEAGNYRTQLVFEKEGAAIEDMKSKGMEVINPEIEGFQAKVKDFVKEFPHLEDTVKQIQETK